ncbi:HAMP domain-containing protein [Paenibacillus sp. GYB004]|uniref:histidine kinase dimerization/phospho-acceptor domain-containing protein n=1 Tax=Paenibacillus sp. GYB004 TaxID=2994393 RepID=UPI002F962210
MTDGEWSTRVDIQGKDELADLGTSLNTLAEQLQQHEHLRVTMTEDIAHELRTPLATLKSHMRALEDGIWEPTPERIHSCYEEIERLTQLVAELEDLTHVESPVFNCCEKKNHWRPLLREVKNWLLLPIVKNVHLRCSVSPHIQVFVDHDRMIQGSCESA